MTFEPTYWSRTCGPFNLEMQQLRDKRWRLDVISDPVVFLTATSEPGLSTEEAQRWAVESVQGLFQEWANKAGAIEWRS
jgi:hypothetical protein